MEAEIKARGPISCSLCVTPAVLNYTKGALSGACPKDAGLHNVVIAGFGTSSTDGDYWIGQNSWGTVWGDDGWFKIARGKNSLGIEANCAWATPRPIKG